MMQSKLLVFFRKDKGECRTYKYGTLSTFSSRDWSVVRHLTLYQIRDGAGCIFSCFTFYKVIGVTYRSGVSDEVACAFLVFISLTNLTKC